MKVVSFELIQRRAYEIWEGAGYPDGLDREHWAQAEQELLEAAPDQPETLIEEEAEPVSEVRRAAEKAVAAGKAEKRDASLRAH
jgi:Protein of unknown function (DUF2934)